MNSFSPAYAFFSDPGHAWLQGPAQEAYDLGIMSKISSYSFRKNENFYLEEDCDAPLFLEARKLKGNNFKILEEYTDDESEIRGYPRIRQ